MQVAKNALGIDIGRNDNNVVITMMPVGKITHHDFEEAMPLVEPTLEDAPYQSVKALIDTSEFEGWDLHAFWDEVKFGAKHGKRFQKVAIVGNEDWKRNVAKVGGWLINGEVQYFEDKEQARRWLVTEH